MSALPPALAAALHEYERALAADDLVALAAAFHDDATRGDHAGLLVGADELAAFRSARGGVPDRRLVHVEGRQVTGTAWLVTSVSRTADGARGLQTQLWTDAGDGWRIAGAHVSVPARALDRSVWRVVGDPLVRPDGDGPLAGLSVAVKDVMAVAGQPVGAGNPRRLAAAPVEPRHAWAVASLLAAGAAVRGIATTDELAYSIAGVNAHHGTPPNARHPGALPGGSSSGPGSAVAHGWADVGLATDTAGSIRVPASYQGVWGLRTTHGLVPRDGVLPLAPSFDTVGWLTRDGGTLERVVAWTTERLGVAPTTPATGPLLVPAEASAAVEPGTRAAFATWLDGLRAAGVPVRDVELGDLAAWQEAFRVVQAAEAWRAHGTWVEAHGDSLGADVAARFRAAAAVTQEQEDAARRVVDAGRAQVRDVVGDGVLVQPTVPGPAPSRALPVPDLDRVRAATLRLTTPAGVAGLPVVSAPVLELGDGRLGRPVGVSFVGAAGTDLGLVRGVRALLGADAAAR